MACPPAKTRINAKVSLAAAAFILEIMVVPVNKWLNIDEKRNKTGWPTIS
jgi:hypothetical protein